MSTETSTVTVELTLEELAQAQLALQYRQRTWLKADTFGKASRDERADIIQECESALLAIEEAKADR